MDVMNDLTEQYLFRGRVHQYLPAPITVSEVTGVKSGWKSWKLVNARWHLRKVPPKVIDSRRTCQSRLVNTNRDPDILAVLTCIDKSPSGQHLMTVNAEA